MLGLDLPIFSELHMKTAFEDRLGVIGRNAGLTILDDPITLDWAADEAEELAENQRRAG